ncbi:MAG: hypothetical protein GY851_15710, partial [bacterium]|nr:hypothetical protein [bacterium]
LAAGFIAAFVLAGALGLLAYSSVRNARTEMRQTLCVHNLKQVACVLNVYAKNNGGRYPDTMSALYPKYIPELLVYVCPEVRERCEKERGIPHPFSSDDPTADEIDALSSYTLVPGLSSNGAANTVVAYEKVDNHSGMGRSLLYLDGRGAWEPPANWRGGPPNATLPEGF